MKPILLLLPLLAQTPAQAQQVEPVITPIEDGSGRYMVTVTQLETTAGRASVVKAACRENDLVQTGACIGKASDYAGETPAVSVSGAFFVGPIQGWKCGFLYEGFGYRRDLSNEIQAVCLPKP